MKKFSTLLLSLLLLGAIFLFLSCTVTQSIVSESVSSGDSDVRLDTTDYFKALVVDLTSFDEKIANSEKDPDTIILDNSIGTLQNKLNESPACQTAIFYRTPAPEKSYVGHIRYLDLVQLVGDMAGDENREDVGSLFTLTDKSLNIRIGMDNYHILSEIVPFLKEENFEAYGPVYNNGSTEEDYLQMMDFILGEETSEKILASNIFLSYKAPSPVLSSNGQIISPDTVQFTVPLIKLLLLNDDINLYCTWT